MPVKIDVAMPEDVEIGDGWVVEWAAVSPTDGSDVSGVTVTKTNVVAADVSDAVTEDEPLGPFMLVPGPGA